MRCDRYDDYNFGDTAYREREKARRERAYREKAQEECGELFDIVRGTSVNRATAYIRTDNGVVRIVVSLVSEDDS